MNNISMVIRN